MSDITDIPTIGVWVCLHLPGPRPLPHWAPLPAAPWPPSASRALMVIGHQAWQRTEMETSGPPPPRHGRYL